MKLKSYKTLSEKKIQFEKDNYYQKFFKENKNNLIQVWESIKSPLNFKSKAKHKNKIFAHRSKQVEMLIII